MLIQHFGAETQGIQGLVDQNELKKPKSLKTQCYGNPESSKLWKLVVLPIQSTFYTNVISC